jgi:hypothetical protein
MEASIYRLRPSAMMMKRKWDKGSPCLIPHKYLKDLEGASLKSMEKNAEEVRLRIQLTKSTLKPIAKRMYFMYCQLNLSNALERSSLRRILRVRVDLRE